MGAGGICSALRVDLRLRQTVLYQFFFCLDRSPISAYVGGGLGKLANGGCWAGGAGWGAGLGRDFPDEAGRVVWRGGCSVGCINIADTHAATRTNTHQDTYTHWK